MSNPPTQREPVGLKAQSVDREKIPPFLLRVFIGRAHHLETDFTWPNRRSPSNRDPLNERQIYTWRDATLRELTDLLKTQREDLRDPKAKLTVSFAFVFPDIHGKLQVKHVGACHTKKRNSTDLLTLDQLQFETGDYLDVAISENAERPDKGPNGDRRGGPPVDRRDPRPPRLDRGGEPRRPRPQETRPGGGGGGGGPGPVRRSPDRRRPYERPIRR